MSQRIWSLSKGRRAPFSLFPVGVCLVMGTLALASGCGDTSSGVPSEEEGLIEAPVEDESGQGNRELTSERKAK